MEGVDKMNRTLNLGNISVYFGVRRTVKVGGYNSNLIGGGHLLLWDFDNSDLRDVILVLGNVQRKYNLPDIYVLQSSSDKSYHANCFVRCDWLMARTIIAATPLVDKKFLSIGILRGFFTLRYTPLPSSEVMLKTIITSPVQSDVKPQDIESIVKYRKKVH